MSSIYIAHPIDHVDPTTADLIWEAEEAAATAVRARADLWAYRPGRAFVVGDARARLRREQHDRRAGLVGGADGDPAHALVADIEPHLEPEHVSIEREGCLGIGVREEAGVDGDVHGVHDIQVGEGGASRFLVGFVRRFAMHGSMPGRNGAPRSR